MGELCFLRGSLPQGAPTSPYITNILLNDLDEAIALYCKINKIRYTRYSDDLAFSGNLKEQEIINLVSNELTKLGLNINSRKTKLMRPGQPQVISGIIVNEKIQVPKSKRNQIRNEMYYIKNFGLVDHLKRIKNNKSNYVKHLKGKINYILFLNPNDVEFMGYREYLFKMSDRE